MLSKKFDKEKRELNRTVLKSDFAIVGGGMAGICAAITAARAGIKVILIQDRPVLGGNASSEVRLWVLGATSHMGNNNRWSREGGVIDEILVENLYKNKAGNPVIFDTILLDKIKQEENITLLLNTVVYDVEKFLADGIDKIFGFCSQNETMYEIASPLFCDASGDGVLGYLSGASYRVGAESSSEYGEKFAPDVLRYGELLGHSIYFYSKDTGKPVKYIAPSYALKDIAKIPRFGNINAGEHGCKFWWLEYGGRKDTIHDTEDIKWELWSVVYGVWDYIKNSGKFQDVENLTLEWVGMIPGKRESRRFEGLYTLVQQDIVEQRHHPDSVAYGGWAIDLHPADGVYSEENGCTQYHSKGIYEIPYGCYVSKDIKNLFFAGRDISVSHVAHGSTRVMATSAFGAQAVGMAAAQCIRKKILPKDILGTKEIEELRQMLNLEGQSIPFVTIPQCDNIATYAHIEASSVLCLEQIPFNGAWYRLDFSVAQMLPVVPLANYELEIELDVLKSTVLEVDLRYSEKPKNYTPDCIAEKLTFTLQCGKQRLKIPFSASVPNEEYAFFTFLKNEFIYIRTSTRRYTGLLTVYNKFNHAVNNYGKQNPPKNSGIDSFEFWCPERRPAGHNIAMNITPAITDFNGVNVINGFTRPTVKPNAWVAALNDWKPELTFMWDEPQTVNQVILYFDTDFDHPMESVQMGHPENRMPFCIKNFKLLNENREILYETKDNYQTIRKISFVEPVKLHNLILQLEKSVDDIPCSLFQIVIRGCIP
ncbi:MAG: FAD-dependent oxidoreductase [Bacteroides sp.]|jgi:hypothetical protein|nr:FAD-dependent oxidoreductase [Bacteroides sp.]MCI1681336.1 FAD-dependent oxidoreductase [Bacteroides sp.]